MIRHQRMRDTLEIVRRFISRKHLKWLTDYMDEHHMIVAFRPAGENSIDKINCGAACKPHDILSKTIKPAELGINDPIMFAELPAIVVNPGIVNFFARSVLCGLVGHRTGNEVTGVYLSSLGVARFANCGFPINLVANSLHGQGYIDCGDTETLVEWMASLLESEKDAKSLFKNFIAGDYDLHEILMPNNAGVFRHLPANSTEEITVLQEMSDRAIGIYVSNIGPVLVPDEFSPIQHGAQDNYIDYSYIREDEVRLVERVVLPALDIAFYNGFDQSWTIITNNAPTTNEVQLLDACRDMSEEIQRYLQVYEASIADRWRMQTDEEIAQLLNCIDKNFYEALWQYLD